MYLTVKQHDKLRTIVMNFEIPFRSYISVMMLDSFKELSDFSTAINNKNSLLKPNDSQFLKSQIGRMVGKPEKIYDLLQKSKNSYENQKVEGDVNVPNVADIIVLTFVFEEIFGELIGCFANFDTYCMQAEKYHYVRNKLGHPGCKILEDFDMSLTLSFISDVCTHIGLDNLSFFWDKSEEEIFKEILALETINIQIPIPIHNINDMPLPDRQIVCREREIESLKEFIYGVPGALRKKSSICIFGYGGLGKTALVMETIKAVVRDIQDEFTVNNYKPRFILFFSAKEESMDISLTSGKLQNREVRKTFTSAQSLQQGIFDILGIKSFNDFYDKGIIVVDNLETLDDEERNKVKRFIQFMSPQEVQYIITSRNEEDYEERRKIEGFEAELGKKFVKTYIIENDLNIDLSDEEVQVLIDISKGNTLVLVLCLRRLSKKLATIHGIVSDFSKTASIQKMSSEFGKLPGNGYEIISEFMFKNTFQEIEKVFSVDAETIFSLLKIFAVYPSDSIDIYTIGLLMSKDYGKIEPIISILCRYLIIEKNGDSYGLNRFAEKYIVQRFLPDSESYMQLSSKIEKSVREIRNELDKLEKDKKRLDGLDGILKDWHIVSDGDRIAAAKAYRLYKEVNSDCNKGSKFFVESGLENAKNEIDRIERTTMHPYVKYQKARILQLISHSRILNSNFDKQIAEAYRDAIWTIKTNMLYFKIKSTKSYASVLWLFGSYLDDKGENEEAIRYLEDSCSNFEKLNIRDKEFYKCFSRLGNAYLIEYIKNKNKVYLKKSRSISDRLYEERNSYISDKALKGYATTLRSSVLQHEKSIRN